MFSISEGIENSSNEIIVRSGVDLLVAPKGSNVLLATGEFEDGRTLSANITESQPGIKYAYPVLRETMFVTANTTVDNEPYPRVSSILARGSHAEVNEIFSFAEVKEGGYLPTSGDPFYQEGTPIEDLNLDYFTHEILINDILADFLKVDLGDYVYLSTSLPESMNNYPLWLEEETTIFQVKGIMYQSFEDEGEMSVTVHLSELQYVTGKYEKDKADLILIDLNNPDDAEEIQEWFNNDYENREKISVFTQDDIREDIAKITGAFQGFSQMVAIITTFVALLFISTIMMISVKERAREISVLRALGHSKSTIFKLVLTESILICVISFIIALVLGYIGVEFVNSYTLSIREGLPKDFRVALLTPTLALSAGGGAILIGVIAGLIPAYWASSVNIVDTLKSE
jgi:ABC-type antimicrobial peptide transport system permease subunit